MFYGCAPISTTVPLGNPAHWTTERHTVARCPVCDGKGLVPPGFYTAIGIPHGYYAPNTGPERCRSCDGKGIVTINGRGLE